MFSVISTEHTAQYTNNDKNEQLSMYLSNKTTHLFGESSSNTSYNTTFHSNTTQSAYTRAAQYNSTEPYSSQSSSTPTFLVPSSFSNSTRSSMDLSSFKHASITASSTVVGTSVNTNTAYFAVNTSPSLSSTAIRNTYIPHQHVPDMIYSPLTKHFFWNTNFFHSQPRSAHENSSSQSLGNVSTVKSNSSAFPIESRITDILSSNCSDANSDSDSLDVSDYGNDSPANILRKRQGSETISSIPEVKKRNPYSIEELLKKPEKRLPHIESVSFQSSIIVNDDSPEPSPKAASVTKGNDNLKQDIENAKTPRSNQFTIEVCD